MAQRAAKEQAAASQKARLLEAQKAEESVAALIREAFPQLERAGALEGGRGVYLTETTPGSTRRTWAAS